jgi:hypothetical protein
VHRQAGLGRLRGLEGSGRIALLEERTAEEPVHRRRREALEAVEGGDRLVALE